LPSRSSSSGTVEQVIERRHIDGQRPDADQVVVVVQHGEGFVALIVDPNVPAEAGVQGGSTDERHSQVDDSGANGVTTNQTKPIRQGTGLQLGHVPRLADGNQIVPGPSGVASHLP
jgi:hypothetical protein